MAIRWMWDDQAVELSGVPEPDEATLNPFGLIGYALMAVTMVAATGRLVASQARHAPGGGRGGAGVNAVSWRCATGRCSGTVDHRA
jgi:hypothetical protein